MDPVYKGGKEIMQMGLNEHTMKLIAIGASISANCQPCLLSAMNMAFEGRADEQEIAEAIEVGKRVRAAAAAKMDMLVLGLNSMAPSSGAEIAGGCGCDSGEGTKMDGKNG